MKMKIPLQHRVQRWMQEATGVVGQHVARHGDSEGFEVGGVVGEDEEGGDGGDDGPREPRLEPEHRADDAQGRHPLHHRSPLPCKLQPLQTTSYYAEEERWS